MKPILKLAFLIPAAWAFGYVSIMAAEKLSALKITNEEGFFDITFKVTKVNQETDGSFDITALSEHEGQAVGFRLKIWNKWKKTPIKDINSHFYWGKGEFHNTGLPTNNLIKLLAKLYEKKALRNSRKIIPVHIVGLANDPSQLLREPTKMKFFLDSDNESTESQVYINTDIKQGIIEFNEKDFEFRELLLRSLSGNPATP